MDATKRNATSIETKSKSNQKQVTYHHSSQEEDQDAAQREAGAEYFPLHAAQPATKMLVLASENKRTSSAYLRHGVGPSAVERPERSANLIRINH